MTTKRTLSIMMGLVLLSSGIETSNAHSPPIAPFEPFVDVVNPKDCLDPDPEAMEQDKCPEGPVSPWSSCPTNNGPCSPGYATRCRIPGTHIDFEDWQGHTNAFYFNPPKVGVGETGKGAIEVDKQLCYFHSFCPCRQKMDGTWACVEQRLHEDWLIKWERSSVSCVTDPPNG